MKEFSINQAKQKLKGCVLVLLETPVGCLVGKLCLYDHACPCIVHLGKINSPLCREY